MRNLYTDGTYAATHPTWHLEDSLFKADEIIRLLDGNNLSFHSMGEIGCGAGGVIRALSSHFPPTTHRFVGFDISTDAIRLAESSGTLPNVSYINGDLLNLPNTFDVLLVIDVVEHVPDYMDFISACKSKARHTVYHIPLDIHVSSVLRGTFTRTRKSLGHLHYFSAETALASLVDCGHRIVDWTYTSGCFSLFWRHPSVKTALANAPRWLVSRVSTKFAARLFGGYSLLVLAE